MAGRQLSLLLKKKKEEDEEEGGITVEGVILDKAIDTAAKGKNSLKRHISNT